jgi:Cu(I)/Ag(I) efflux system membrane fusion protein
MTKSRFTLAPAPQFGATLALLIAAYSTPVLAMLGAPLASEASSARFATAEATAGAAADGDSKPSDKSPRYTCPMHPEVDSDKPGRCPHCGMKLVEKEKSEDGGQS